MTGKTLDVILIISSLCFLGSCQTTRNQYRTTTESTRRERGQRKPLIVDTDLGEHSLLALLVALESAESDVVAVTTVAGSTNVDQVYNNVRQVLQTTNRDRIPVYRGAQRPLIEQNLPNSNNRNGGSFGGSSSRRDNDDVHSNTSAAEALVAYSKRYSRDGLRILATGPLTNIALALRLNPEFGNAVEDIAVVEGNDPAMECNPLVGDNFIRDPEAANITLSGFKKPVKVVTRKCCYNNTMSWRTYDSLVNVNNARGQLLKRVTSSHDREMRQDRRRPRYESCSPLAAVMLTNPNVVRSRREVAAVVELSGEFTRGAMMIQGGPCRDQRRTKNIEIACSYDTNRVERIFERSLGETSRRSEREK